MWKQIFKTTFLAGSLDITAACVNAYLSGKIMPGSVLKFIVSGVFGKAAFEGGYGIMAWGLFFHFVIAFACTATFFLLYTKLKFLTYSHLLNSLLIAVIAWSVTNLVIMPLSNTPPITFRPAKAATAIGILIVCIGLPLSYFTKKFYYKNQ